MIETNTGKNENIHSFAPLIRSGAKVLILGSIPGVKSLAQGEYYANPNNQFWKVIGTLINEDMDVDYSGKCELLAKHRIGLWDVIGSCERKGSLDTDIKNEQVNDFERLLNQHSEIACIAFNGGKAYETFLKKVNMTQHGHIALIKMPSTSPAHTAKFGDKLESWKALLQFIG